MKVLCKIASLGCRCVLLFALLIFTQNVFAFQPLRTDGGMKIHWEKNPVIYKIHNGTSDPCVGNTINTINAAFNVWASVPTQILNVQYGGTTPNNEFCGMDYKGTGCDSENIILFAPGSYFPSGVLAMTVNYYRVSDGVIMGTDMAFNDSFNWSDDPGVCNGYSLPGVAVHEIGHFYGLDHSFCSDIGATFTPSIAATMYPYYFDNDYAEMLTLEQDDIAGVTWMYPDPALTGWGKIKGRVKYKNGQGLFGVQVTAIRASDKVPVVTTFTRGTGKYTLYGLPPDDYYVYVNTPRISGTLFTNFVSDYWSDPDKVPYILLYKQVKVNKRSNLGPGGIPFTKPEAKIITVVADTTITDVNFTYPNP